MEWIQYLSVFERVAVLIFIASSIVAIGYGSYKLLKNGKFNSKYFEYQPTREAERLEKPRHDIFQEEPEIDFSTHEIFDRIETFLNIDLANFELTDPGRDLMFKDMLRIYWSENKKTKLITLLPELQQSTNVYQLKHLMIQAIAESVSKSKDDFILAGVPAVVIEKYSRRINIFNGFIINYVDEVCTRPITRNQMIDLYLLAMLAAINTLLIWFRSLFDELNGELDNVEYKGVVCRRAGHNHSGPLSN